MQSREKIIVIFQLGNKLFQYDHRMDSDPGNRCFHHPTGKGEGQRFVFRLKHHLPRSFVRPDFYRKRSYRRDFIIAGYLFIRMVARNVNEVDSQFIIQRVDSNHHIGRTCHFGHRLREKFTDNGINEITINRIGGFGVFFR